MTAPLLRYRVVVDQERLATVPKEADTWFRGRLLRAGLHQALGEPAPTVEVHQEFATDRSVFRTDDPDLAAALTALQSQGGEGMVKAVGMLEERA